MKNEKAEQLQHPQEALVGREFVRSWKDTDYGSYPNCSGQITAYIGDNTFLATINDTDWLFTMSQMIEEDWRFFNPGELLELWDQCYGRIARVSAEEAVKAKNLAVEV